MSNGKKTSPPIQKNIFKAKFQASLKTIGIYSLITIAALVFFYEMTGSSVPGKEVPISQILTDIKENKITKIQIDGEKIIAEVKNSSDKVTARKEPNESIYQVLSSAGVDPKTVTIEVRDNSVSQLWYSILSGVLPVAVMLFFFLFLFRQAKDAGQGLFSFSQSKARLFNKDAPQIRFTDVAGSIEAKKELEEVVDFLKSAQKYKDVGARIPKGVLLVGPPGCGKCVTGDTIIWTNKGLMDIKDVPRYYYVDDRSHQVYGAGLASFNAEKVYSEDKFASHWYDLDEQDTVKIKSAQGFSLEGTPEHPVIVMTSDGELRFRNLDQIQEGDYLAIQYGRGMFGKLDVMDNDTAYLLGLLTGDGNLSHSSHIGLTSIDPEIVVFYKQYIQTHYPQAKIYLDSKKQSYLVSNWDLKKYLYQMGMSYLLSFDKTIPPTVLQASKPVQIAFLQGLFDTDATIGRNHAEFEYTTVSEKMAQQVQMMLLNLGVVASLNIKGKKENGYYRSVYRLYISGASLRIFGQSVGFRLTRKQKLLTGYSSKTHRINTNIDIFPGIAHAVEESWRILSDKRLSNEKWAKSIDKVRRRGRISRELLSEFVLFASSKDVDVPHLEYFRSLLEAKLFFSKVTEKSYGRARVYDFTVPDTHSFSGNGFINHNTLISRAVAGEAGVPFFSIAGSEFMEMLVGVGAARVRDMFAPAKKASPAIIFIDEVESIGRARGMGGMSGGHDEREQTLNQILVEMDGFTPNDHVIVLAATNRPDLLDPALVRPGRFDRRVLLSMPDIEERKTIITLHMKGKPFTKEVNIEKLARRTVGFSGADLANMLNEAAILAARENKKDINEKDLEEAATKVKMGPQRKRMQSEEDRKLAAYHEAGHAIVGHFLPNVDPVHRITIVSRGMSGGHTMFPPTQDRSNETKSRLLEQIATALGGRAAEEMILKDISTGASNDIEVATNIAREMVTEYGMSLIGPINIKPQAMFGMWRGDDGAQISPDMQARIDKEVGSIMNTAYKQAKALLAKNRLKLDKVAKALLEKETLDNDEFEKLVGAKLTSVKP